MRKLLLVGAVGVVAMVARRLYGIFRRSTDDDAGGVRQ
jgi:hypothetical protein